MMNIDANVPDGEKNLLEGAEENESRYQNLFMTIDDAAFISDAVSGEILDANRAAERLYGYTRQELLGMNISALLAARGSSFHDADAVHGGLHQSTLLRYHKKKSGTVFPVEASSGSFGSDGRRCRFEIHRDLAGRRSVESELRNSAARLELYLNAMHDGLLDWNISTDEVFYSPGWIAMLGYEPDDVPPFAIFWRSIVHRGDESRLQSAIDEHLSGRTARLNLELRMRAKDQAWKWMACRGSVVEWDETGAPHRLIATFVDITAGKRAESDLRSIIMSEVYERLFIKLRVFRHGESMAMNLNRLLLFAQNITDLHAALRRHMGDQAHSVQMPAAQRVHVAVNEFNLLVYPELRSIGRLLQAIGDDDINTNNIPMPRTSGRELLKLNENVSQLVGQMKTVLTGSSHDESSGVDVKALRSAMLRDLDSLKHLVNDLMKLVESELACDAGKTVETAVARYAANPHGIPVMYMGSASGKLAVGKPGEIGEIVSILIRNAFEAIESLPPQTGREHRIDVNCSDCGGKIVIAVEDTGPGVEEPFREKIFDDGFTTKSDGHGFGLNYARTALIKYGGKITYEPNNPHGARFVIELIVLN